MQQIAEAESQTANDSTADFFFAKLSTDQPRNAIWFDPAMVFFRPAVQACDIK